MFKIGKFNLDILTGEEHILSQENKGIKRKAEGGASSPPPAKQANLSKPVRRESSASSSRKSEEPRPSSKASDPLRQCNDVLKVRIYCVKLYRYLISYF